MKLQQDQIIEYLKNNSSAYPHKTSKIQTKETHISWILLTGPYAYKIKKELKFGGVLDFSTLSLRKKYCKIEVDLNKPLCGSMYKGVVKIIQKGNELKFVNTDKPGRPLEYAVKMKEIPQKYRMDHLMEKSKVTRGTIKKISDILVNFHKKTPTNNSIKKFGKPRFVEEKINENFRTLALLKTINPKFEKNLLSFIHNNQDLFWHRIKCGKVREIHGDLYTKNIFIMNQNSKFFLYDRIEFNSQLRYADVLEDLAHLAMDLDYHSREDLSKILISEYETKTNDADLKPLVYFFMCYKACMRAKVALFRAKNEQESKIVKQKQKEAKKLLSLAEKYLDLF